LDRLPGPAAETSSTQTIKLQRALTVPRFNRDSPPSHILVAKTGDLKRGTLLGIRNRMIQFESKLRTQQVPLDRISRVIEVSRPGAIGKTEPDPPGDTPGEATPHQSMEEGFVRTTLVDGSAFIFIPQGSKGGSLSGHSPIYGRTTLPIDSIHNVAFGVPESENPGSLFADWVVRPAQEPRFSE
jgi:hypothetical protein